MSLVQGLRSVVLGGVGGAAGFMITKYVAPDLYSETNKITSTEKNDDVSNSKTNSILKYGIPSCGLSHILHYQNHILEYDPSKKVPKWVAEHISQDKAFGSQANRKVAKFDPDPQVPDIFTSHNKDYWRSGWSRGHMAPAGNNKHCQEAMNQTFFLTNIVPQDLDNNGNYWNRLEIYCRELTKLYSDVYIISGPLWLPELESEDATCDATYLPIKWKNYKHSILKLDDVGNLVQSESEILQSSSGDTKKRPQHPKKFVKYQVLGSNNVAVPTHLYKIILVEDPKLEKPMLAGFVIPNRPVQNVNLEEFEVEVEEIEKHVGVKFHQDLDRSMVDPLCLRDGCRLNNYKEFQHFFWNRALTSPWNLGQLERDWKIICKRGLKTDKLEELYLTKKNEFIEKEQKKKDTAIISGAAGDNIIIKQDDKNETKVAAAVAA